MMRNRKVWGVLGSLLALAVALNTSTVQAWSSLTHAWIIDQVPAILRNVEYSGYQYDNYADIVQMYLAQLKQGAQDADIVAWNADGTKKKYGFKYMSFTWEVWSDQKILESIIPAWLRPFLEWLYKDLDLDTWFATIEQFDSEGRLDIYCTNCRTAGESANDYYNLAVQRWQAGNKAEAMLWLGRALHMLQDVTTPFHATSNRIYFITHPLFGKVYRDMCNWAQENHSQLAVNEGMAYCYPLPGTTNCCSWQPSEWVRRNSVQAIGYRGDVDGIPGDDIPKVVKAMLPLAQRSNSEFIACFLYNMGIQPVPPPPDVTLRIEAGCDDESPPKRNVHVQVKPLPSGQPGEITTPWESKYKRDTDVTLIALDDTTECPTPGGRRVTGTFSHWKVTGGAVATVDPPKEVGIKLTQNTTAVAIYTARVTLNVEAVLDGKAISVPISIGREEKVTPFSMKFYKGDTVAMTAPFKVDTPQGTCRA
jgi:hypothetical protein